MKNKLVFMTALLLGLLTLSPILAGATSTGLKSKSSVREENKSSQNTKKDGIDRINSGITATFSNEDNNGDKNKSNNEKSIPKGLLRAPGIQEKINAIEAMMASSTASTTVTNLKGKGVPAWLKWFFNIFQKQAVLTITQIKDLETTTTATIDWTTSEAVSSQVLYGTVKPITASSTSSVDATVTTNHSVTLSGLTPDTTYYFIITASDTNGNVKQTETKSFHTQSLTAVDNTAPRIIFSNTFKVSSSSADIVWVTDEASNSKLWMNTGSTVDTSLAPTASSNTATFFHELNTGSLATSTTYFYTFTSTDASGNTATSTGHSFTTLAL